MFLRKDFYDLDSFVVVDIETEALHNPQKLHCVVSEDLDGTVQDYIEPLKNENDRRRLVNLLSDPTKTIVGHNFLRYDGPVLRRLLPEIDLPDDRILDTYILSLLFNYGMGSGHSLEAWGDRIGVAKKFAKMTDFSAFTPELLERCHSDVKVNKALLKRFMRFVADPEWHPSILIEHFVATICIEMEANGLPFSVEAAEKLRKNLQDRVEPIDEELQRDFPPRIVPVRTVEPRKTATGFLHKGDFRWWTGYEPLGIGPNDLSVFTGGPFTIIEARPFNPGSPVQIVERLNEAGWKPTEKTKGHIKALRDRRSVSKERLAEFRETGWKVSEENLKTLPDTAPSSARKLAERISLVSRVSDLDEWLGLVTPDQRIHPRFQSIGAWTHRLSHSRPNSANIPVAKRSPKDTAFQTFINDCNDQMRDLFGVDTGCRLVGTDADGIQMRIFAELVNDERLFEAIINGRKEDETDIHSLHKGFLGSVCKSRDAAKTFIYAWLLGAASGMVASILECNIPEAKQAEAYFVDAYPGLRALKKQKIPRDASRGFFIGLDGRKVVCDSEHLMMSGYLQNGEKVIMARAMRIWYENLLKEKIPFSVLNWVHDEWQTMIPDDDGICEHVQHLQKEAFVQTGKELNMKMPLLGSSSWGYTWKETH